VLDGVVSVSTDKSVSRRSNKTILTPGQQASISSEDGKTIKLENISFPDNYIAWIYGYLVFKEEPLQDVLKRISRYYNINIEPGNSIKNLKVTGKLDLKEDPERVLNGISITIKAKLIKMDDKYIFNKEKKKPVNWGKIGPGKQIKYEMLCSIHV